MNLQWRRKIAIYLLLLTLIFGNATSAFAKNTNDNAPEAQGVVYAEEVELTKELQTPKVEDIKEMTPNANVKIKNEVVNETNDNLKNLVHKFLMAMAGVIISSIVIFLAATFVNKTGLTKNNSPVLSQKTETESPQTDDVALKVFFEKTR